jgi:hypothetical protein
MTARYDNLVNMMFEVHRTIERRTDLLRGEQAAQRERLVAELIDDVSRYRRTAAHHLDPLVRRYLPDGGARADHQLCDYVQMQLTAEQLRRRHTTSAHDELLGRLVAQLHDHIEEQEHELLPQMREHVPDDVLQQRGMLARREG